MSQTYTDSQGVEWHVTVREPFDDMAVPLDLDLSKLPPPERHIFFQRPGETLSLPYEGEEAELTKEDLADLLAHAKMSWEEQSRQ